MSLALSTSVLFTLLMQSVNGAQFSITTFLFALFALLISTIFSTYVVPLVNIYASL